MTQPQRALKTSPEIAGQYLLDYLEDEFRKYPEVRIRRVPKSHQEDGVVVKTEAREYFFSTSWVIQMRMDRVKAEAQRIKEVLPER